MNAHNAINILHTMKLGAELEYLYEESGDRSEGRSRYEHSI